MESSAESLSKDEVTAKPSVSVSISDEERKSDNANSGGTDKAEDATLEPPDTLCCPITLLLFRDPVVVATGFTYERQAITRYWQNSTGRGATCPKTNLRVDPCRVITNWAVRAAVERWLDDNPSYNPEGWETRELLPTPRRRSSARDDFMEVINRMREQVNEMEQLARDCAREAVAARDALGALHLFQRRLGPILRKVAVRGLILVFVSVAIAFWMFPEARLSDFVLSILLVVIAQLVFTIWYALRWSHWLCRTLAPLVREITASRNPPDPDERFQLAYRALFSTELVDNIT
eukprot:GEMP01037882.1.p1 GENE.GEMP01037882.1~~GEMP01037882.1.p1  ORF type:complete len:292 (+),score=60.02 GEMP01037882.1:77-952(+)